MVQRTVRFVEAMLLDHKGNQHQIGQGWWDQVLCDVGNLPVGDRELIYRDTRYTAEARSPRSPATPYLYFGRLRAHQDFPDSYHRDVGIEGHLVLDDPDRELSEGTYVVPFGDRNYAAMMSPQSGATRLPPLVSWLNETFGYIDKDESLALLPVLDAELQAKLKAAVGASRVHVRLTPEQSAEGIAGAGGEALRAAGNIAPDEGFVELTLSFGQGRRGSEEGRSSLLGLVRQLKDRPMAAAEVSLQIEEDGVVRSEQHDLLLDRVSHKVSISNVAGGPASEEQILHAIAGAISATAGRRGTDSLDRSA